MSSVNADPEEQVGAKNSISPKSDLSSFCTNVTISKLDSTEKRDSNFGNLCMKKGGSFQKERFLLFFKSLMGGFDPQPPLVRTPLQTTSDFACDATLQRKISGATRDFK